MQLKEKPMQMFIRSPKQYVDEQAKHIPSTCFGHGKCQHTKCHQYNEIDVLHDRRSLLVDIIWHLVYVANSLKWMVHRVLEKGSCERKIIVMEKKLVSCMVGNECGAVGGACGNDAIYILSGIHCKSSSWSFYHERCMCKTFLARATNCGKVG